jgi:hypothetical protein
MRRISRPPSSRGVVSGSKPHALGHLLSCCSIVPRGHMKTNLLGMSFLDRLESWGVRSDRLMLHGYPELSSRK